jgi:hypothetical protein
MRNAVNEYTLRLVVDRIENAIVSDAEAVAVAALQF